MNRRGFLASILAAGYAPAAIGSGVLMPICKVWTPGLSFVVPGPFEPVRTFKVFVNDVEQTLDEHYTVSEAGVLFIKQPSGQGLRIVSQLRKAQP